jgi:hypothetical protein
MAKNETVGGRRFLSPTNSIADPQLMGAGRSKKERIRSLSVPSVSAEAQSTASNRTVTSLEQSFSRVLWCSKSNLPNAVRL